MQFWWKTDWNLLKRDGCYSQKILTSTLALFCVFMKEWMNWTSPLLLWMCKSNFSITKHDLNDSFTNQTLLKVNYQVISSSSSSSTQQVCTFFKKITFTLNLWNDKRVSKLWPFSFFGWLYKTHRDSHILNTFLHKTLLPLTKLS